MEWNANTAYAIGLIATDGSLSKDKRHIDFSSKDLGQIKNFLKCMNKNNKIGKKKSGDNKICYRVQIGDVKFYNDLIKIGLFPNKTKTIGKLKIPDNLYFDFLRGHFDGDGTIYGYLDKRWKSSFLFYLTFVSASLDHLNWLRRKNFKNSGTMGHVTKAKNSSIFQLKYGKKESLKLLGKMYYNNAVTCLERKRSKVAEILKKANADVVKLAYTLP